MAEHLSTGAVGAVGAARLGIGLAAVARPAYITAGRDRDLAGTAPSTG